MKNCLDFGSHRYELYRTADTNSRGFSGWELQPGIHYLLPLGFTTALVKLTVRHFEFGLDAPGVPVDKFFNFAVLWCVFIDIAR